MQQPTLHKPVPLGSRVKIPNHYLNEKGLQGEVIGISSCHVIFIYIVLLDKETETPFGKIRGVCVPGSELEGINGENWRLDD